MSDITIAGDVKAQQGIRFNIFQLNQTYLGKDSRLNIGPKTLGVLKACHTTELIADYTTTPISC